MRETSGRRRKTFWVACPFAGALIPKAKDIAVHDGARYVLDSTGIRHTVNHNKRELSWMQH
jgi:hypothetical protein